MTSTLKLQVNIPQVIALAFAEGKPVQSSYTGEEFMFSLATPADHRIFLPPVVADKIRQAGIGARVPFEICKKQVGRAIEYQINTHNRPNETGALVERAPVRTSPNSTTTETSVSQRTLRPIPDGPRAPQVMTTRLMSALLSAIEAVIEAETYMAKQGLDIQFTSEDIRALGITAYIQDSKEQGGRA